MFISASVCKELFVTVGSAFTGSNNQIYPCLDWWCVDGEYVKKVWWKGEESSLICFVDNRLELMQSIDTKKPFSFLGGEK